MEVVKIEITLKQAELLRQALEWSARTAIGQMSSSHLPSEIQVMIFDDPKENPDGWLERRDAWDTLANEMKMCLHPGLTRSRGHSYSYNHSEFSTNACAMEKMLAVRIKEHKDKSIPARDRVRSVNSSYTDIYNVPQPKITIE